MEIQRSLDELVELTEGVETILITDLDGVPVARTGEELRMRSGLIQGQQATAEQVAKLNMGTPRSLLFVYEKTQVWVSQITPLIVYVTASVNANRGMLYAMRERLETIVESIKKELPDIPQQ